MKNLKITCLFVFTLFLSLTGFSQQIPISSIQKNVNDAAAGLEQYLNATSDTLMLKSDTDILRVTFLNHNEKDSEIIDVGSREVKIPLYHFKKGRYTIAVYTNEHIIALGANRIDDIPVPKDATADLEESILRSSLSNKEQVARNMKPLKTKPQVSKEEHSNTISAASRGEKITKGTATKAKKTTRPSDNQKSGFALALEKQEQKNKLQENKETDKEANEDVASKEKKEETQSGTLITVTKVSYNLSRIPNKNSERQTREEFRENNLRPNGTKYKD